MGAELGLQQPTLPSQASGDEQLLALWLHGRPVSTQTAYRREAGRLLALVGMPLRMVTLSDVQAFADRLTDLAPASQARAVNAVKSLLTFGYSVGYLQFNVGRALKAPKVVNARAERILSEGDVQRMLALEPNRRNRVLLRLLYGAGLRVSELCSLRWRDTQARDGGGQIAVVGKGSKLRYVLLPAAVWNDIDALRLADALPNAPVFVSRKNRGAISAEQVWRVVKAAANRAGIAASPSPHWLRHAHASHALDRGAPVHLVQATLGHASLAITSVYAHSRPTESSAAYLAL